jgi:hypothetical protein
MEEGNCTMHVNIKLNCISWERVEKSNEKAMKAERIDNFFN